MVCATKLLRHGSRRINTNFQKHGLGRAFVFVWGGHSCPPPLNLTLTLQNSSMLYSCTPTATRNPTSTSKAADKSVRPTLALPGNFPVFSFSFHKQVPSSTVSAQLNISFPLRLFSAFAQSAHSASVSCIEPAGDCGRAGGDRRFSRVNRREGFQKMRFGALQKTRALRPPQTVLPKKLDLCRPLPQSLRVKNPRIKVFG